MTDTSLTAELDAHSADEVLWLGTVTPSGRPTTRPVWFVRDGDDLVLFSEPGAAKVRHVRENPQVVVSFPSDPGATKVRVMDGTATLAEQAPSSYPGYLEKYEQHYPAVGYDRAGFDATYNTALRITPTRTWGW